MSKDLDERRGLIDQVSREIAELQEATELVDEAVVVRLGVNPTDRRCLWVLFSQGPLSAGDLARASGLSPGAATTAIDRLERAGYARRVRDSSDRRSVIVELTDEARRRIDELYGPIGEEGRARLERYSDRQLVLLRDFLREGRALQIEHAARIRDDDRAGKASTAPA
jgi:DNA-binding MarR family transcriptional regulator